MFGSLVPPKMGVQELILPQAFFRYVRSQLCILIFGRGDELPRGFWREIVRPSDDETAISNYEQRQTASPAARLSKVFIQRHPLFSAVTRYRGCFCGNDGRLPTSECLRSKRYVDAGSNPDSIRNGGSRFAYGIAIANRACDGRYSGAYGGPNAEPDRSEAGWSLGNQRQPRESERRRSLGNSGKWQVQFGRQLRT
jgi:hypothetical protein